MSMILIVEAENSIGEIVELNLKLAQHSTIRVTTAEEALELIASGR